MKNILFIITMLLLTSCNSKSKRPLLGNTPYQQKLNATYKDASKSPLKKKDLNARIEKNLKALEVLTKQSSSLDKEESKTILNGYSGWGGLRDAIFTPSIYGQLRKHLTVEEIEEIIEQSFR